VTSVTLRGVRRIEPENILVETLLRNALRVFTSATFAAQSKFAPTPMMRGDHHGHFEGIVFGIKLDGVERLGQCCFDTGRPVAVCVVWIRK